MWGYEATFALTQLTEQKSKDDRKRLKTLRILVPPQSDVTLGEHNRVAQVKEEAALISMLLPYYCQVPSKYSPSNHALDFSIDCEPLETAIEIVGPFVVNNIANYGDAKKPVFNYAPGVWADEWPTLGNRFLNFRESTDPVLFMSLNKSL